MKKESNMKTTLSLIYIICILTFSSCSKWSDTPVKTVFFTGEEINGLSLQLHPNTIINRSDTNSISVEINETLLKHLKVTKDANGIVTIAIDNKFTMPSTGKFIYNVIANVSKINFIESHDGADIVVNGKFEGESSKIVLNGGATIKGLNLTLSDKYTANLWGASKIDDTISCPNIEAQIQLQSAIKSHILSCNNIKYNIAGKSTITLTSIKTENPFNNITINSTDDAVIDAATTPFKTANVTLNQSSSKLFVKDSLTCNLTYKSTLHYKGTPIITQNISSDSKLIDDNEPSSSRK